MTTDGEVRVEDNVQCIRNPTDVNCCSPISCIRNVQTTTRERSSVLQGSSCSSSLFVALSPSRRLFSSYRYLCQLCQSSWAELSGKIVIISWTGSMKLNSHVLFPEAKLYTSIQQVTLFYLPVHMKQTAVSLAFHFVLCWPLVIDIYNYITKTLEPNAVLFPLLNRDLIYMNIKHAYVCCSSLHS